jgi:hypothetical protein
MASSDSPGSSDVRGGGSTSLHMRLTPHYVDAICRCERGCVESSFVRLSMLVQRPSQLVKRLKEHSTGNLPSEHSLIYSERIRHAYINTESEATAAIAAAGQSQPRMAALV